MDALRKYWASDELKNRMRELAKGRAKAPASHIRIDKRIIDRLDRTFKCRDDKRKFIEEVLEAALDDIFPESKKSGK